MMCCDEDEIWTREEIDEFTQELEDLIRVKIQDEFRMKRGYITNNILEIDWSYRDIDVTSARKIDMRRIKDIDDLNKKYMTIMQKEIETQCSVIDQQYEEIE